VLKALALTQGLLPYAYKRAYIYRRDTDGKTVTEIPVELSRIMDRKAEDVDLLPNDVLYVPDNKGRRMTLTALDKIAGFGSATTSGLLIWRR